MSITLQERDAANEIHWGSTSPHRIGIRREDRWYWRDVRDDGTIGPENDSHSDADFRRDEAGLREHGYLPSDCDWCCEHNIKEGLIGILT